MGMSLSIAFTIKITDRLLKSLLAICIGLVLICISLYNNANHHSVYEKNSIETQTSHCANSHITDNPDIIYDSNKLFVPEIEKENGSNITSFSGSGNIDVHSTTDHGHTLFGKAFYLSFDLNNKIKQVCFGISDIKQTVLGLINITNKKDGKK